MNRFAPINMAGNVYARWTPWPAFYDHSIELLRLLAALRSDQAAFAECLATADRIIPGDDDSWYHEWQAMAERCKRRALANRDRRKACAGWLRASSFFRASEIFLEINDDRRSSAVENMRACSRRYLELLEPTGEIVSICAPDSHVTEGYFLRAPDTSTRTPVVLCVGGWNEFKDSYLTQLPRFAWDRGLSLLLIEPPQPLSGPETRRFGRFDVASSISSCIDYLLARVDVDGDRIGLYGVGLGASFATEAAARDSRVAGVVCDGGALELRRRESRFRHMLDAGNDGDAEAPLDRLRRHSLRQGVDCPALIAVNEDDWLAAESVEEDSIHWDRLPVEPSLKVFSIDQGTLSAVTSLGPSTAVGYIFDWIASSLAKAGAAAPVAS